MSNGRKAKGGTSILKKLAGGNGEKTKVAERRMPRGSDTPTEPGRKRQERSTFLKPASDIRGRHERYRSYAAGRAGRERQPKVETEEHRARVEEHKRTHRPAKDDEVWVLGRYY